MSEADDALREMAANRGCKLTKSRRRKPGGDYGRYGLKDAKTGKEVFGFGEQGLTATAAEVEAFLRGGAASRWKSSLGSAGKGKAPPRRSRARPKPAEPEPAKTPVIREARPGDADAIAKLLAELGYEAGAGDVRRRIAQLRKAGEPPLVAERGTVVACLSWHVTPVLHRPRPVGRLTMMVVAEEARGGGIGTSLLAAAEARLRERGCGLVEVTSNVKRLRAHDFYRRLGFERTSYRFVKSLAD